MRVSAAVPVELNEDVGVRELLAVLLDAPDDDAERDREPATLGERVDDRAEVLVGV